QTRLRDFNHQDLTEFEDTGIISFDFTQGGSGILCYSTSVWDTNFESSLTIIAENGTIKIGGQYMDKVEYCHVKGYEIDQADLINREKGDGSSISTTNHGLLIQNVIDVLNGTDSITTNALEGLKVVDIIERIYNNT
ncbi:MAG: gfo/Idh/MocA family oxidoreductase, partial [Owenweeksia sp.]